MSTELLTGIGAFVGAAIAAFIFIYRILPKRMNGLINNDLRHIREELNKLSILPESFARLDERMKNVEGDVEALFKRFNQHIDGSVK